MRVSAKADYAVRAAVELATQPAEVPVKADQIAVSQDIPLRFLENILYELRQNDIVELSRGADGGYYLVSPRGHDHNRRSHPRGRGPCGLGARL